jgi:hypothetical protein
LDARRLENRQEIICIAGDPFSEDTIRIVIGTRDRLVQVWNVDAKAQMTAIFAVQLDKTVPKVVAFSKNSDDVRAFGLYGDMCVNDCFSKIINDHLALDMCFVAMMERFCPHKQLELQCEQGYHSPKNELT